MHAIITHIPILLNISMIKGVLKFLKFPTKFATYTVFHRLDIIMIMHVFMTNIYHIFKKI